MSSNIKENAKDGIAKGINLCRRAVEGTIGGRGTNAIIRQEFYPYYIRTKDAFSIIQSIKSDDPLEKQAVDMMKDATDSMNKRSKDGRTTMCILTDEILTKATRSGLTGLEVEEGINSLLPLIEKEIDKQSRPITVDEVEAVATTASDSERLGKLIAGVYKAQGKDCIINHVEASGTFDDVVELKDGVHFIDTGFLSPAMVHDEEARKANRVEKKAVYQNPAILVTKRKISTDNDIAPLIEALLLRNRKDLIIFTNDMDSDVAQNLINTHKEKIMNICIVKAPTLWTNYVFEDFAKVTGATIVEDSTGVNFKNLALEHLGTCGRIEVDKEETIINGIVDISDHIADLKARGDNDSKLRLWWLTTKTATLKLGANNEGELSLLRLKAEDAIHSSQLALHGGIVAGGGVALLNVAQKLPQTVIGSILVEALKAPLLQIKKNAGKVNAGVLQGEGGTIGFDAKSGKIVDMFEAGIVDSAIVVKNAIRNAIGIASGVLTTNILVDLPKRTTEELQLEILGKQRGPF